MTLDFAVAILRCRLQNDFIPRSFLTALKMVIFVTFLFIASAAVGCNEFAVMNPSKLTKNLIVRIRSLLGM